MIYQYIFGRDTEIGYKTINASTKLKTEGEYAWQNKLNIEYIPPENAVEEYPEPVVYFNIKDQTSVVGKMIYQTSQQRNNYMQHYYLLEGNEREEFLTNNYQFDIKHFESTIEDSYTTDVENQDIYSHIPFTVADAKKVVATQKISKKVLELIIFSCFEAVSTDEKVLFINSVANKETTDNNLELLKVIFSILPPVFKEKLGFITYYKYLLSPIGKVLRSDIKIIFTESSEQNLVSRNKAIREGNHLFDFANNKTAINTENILYGSLLEFLTEPFFSNRSITEVINVLDSIIACFSDPYRIKYNLASIVYEILYRGRKIDCKIAEILLDEFELLGDRMKTEFEKWFLSDRMKACDESELYPVLFKAYTIEEYRNDISEYFAERISTKQPKYIDVLFNKQIPFKLMENVCKKLLNEERFLEGGKFLLHTCILNSKDVVEDIFSPIGVFDVLKYFSQFSNQYFKYFDELEIYENYFRNNINSLDITGFENLSNSFSKLIASIENEVTVARLQILHKLILKRYILSHFKIIDEYPNIHTSIDICFKLLNCAKAERDYLQEDLESCLNAFTSDIVSTRNLNNFENVDYLFKKAIENYKSIDTFLKIFEETLIQAFSKENLSTDEYNRLFKYAKELGIKLDTRKIKNFEILDFNAKLKNYMINNDISGILRLIENQGICLKLDTKNDLISWLKNTYKGIRNNEFFRLLIYLYADDYNVMFSFIDKDDDYKSLMIYMKEMKGLGQTNNKEYMNYLSNYINDDRKLKKYLKTLNTNQKKELGLNNFAEATTQSNFLENLLILYTAIYALFGVCIFLTVRTLNLSNTLLLCVVNAVLALAIYGFWIYKFASKSVIITRVFTSVFAVSLFAATSVGIIQFAQPSNLFVRLYKNIYNMKTDYIAPVIAVKSINIDDSGNISFDNDAVESIDVNGNGSSAIMLQIDDENKVNTTAKLNETEQIIEDGNIIILNGEELAEENNKLTIISEDIYKNKSSLTLNVTKKAIVANNVISATFSGSVYDSSDTSAVSNGPKFSIPKNGKMELDFNIKASDKYIVTAKFNEEIIPLQSMVFSQDGCTGKLNFNYNNIEAENNLIITVSSEKESKEYPFNIVKLD